MPDYRPNKFGYASGVPSLSEVFDSFDKMSEAANQRQAQAQLQDVRGQQELAQIARSKELEQANQMALEQERANIASQKQNEALKQYFDLRNKLTKQGQPGARYNIGFTPGGGFNVSEAEADPNRVLQVDLAKDREATKLSDRINKAELPEISQAINQASSAGDSTTKGLYGLLGVLPFGDKLKGVAARGEAALTGNAGPLEEISAYGSLKNKLQHALYGTAVTPQEQQSLSDQLGSNNAKVRKAALNRINELMAEKAKNIQAGFHRDIQSRYLENAPGAQLPMDMFKKAPAKAGKMSYEDWVKAGKPKAGR